MWATQGGRGRGQVRELLLLGKEASPEDLGEEDRLLGSEQPSFLP